MQKDHATEYSEVTHDVEVLVQPFFIRERSRPEENYFFFGYQVQITNHSAEELVLLSRHWIIRDGTGKVEVVRGDGVVGEQPVLAPGTSFSYTSACPLRTPAGNMRGTYLLRNNHGQDRQVKIPLFFLRGNQSLH